VPDYKLACRAFRDFKYGAVGLDVKRHDKTTQPPLQINPATLGLCLTLPRALRDQIVSVHLVLFKFLNRPQFVIFPTHFYIHLFYNPLSETTGEYSALRRFFFNALLRQDPAIVWQTRPTFNGGECNWRPEDRSGSRNSGRQTEAALEPAQAQPPHLNPTDSPDITAPVIKSREKGAQKRQKSPTFARFSPHRCGPKLAKRLPRFGQTGR
jgi:hypothetical protein